MPSQTPLDPTSAIFFKHFLSFSTQSRPFFPHEPLNKLIDTAIIVHQFLGRSQESTLQRPHAYGPQIGHQGGRSPHPPTHPCGGHGAPAAPPAIN